LVARNLEKANELENNAVDLTLRSFIKSDLAFMLTALAIRAIIKPVEAAAEPRWGVPRKMMPRMESIMSW
jgi:hypothetical protein